MNLSYVGDEYNNICDRDEKLITILGPWIGGSVGESVVLTHQGCGFRPQSRAHTRINQ